MKLPAVRTAASAEMARVWISSEALRIVRSVSLSALPYEVGGILLGYRNGPETVVVEATRPGPSAICTRFTFDPDQRYDRSLALERYQSSGSILTYLGDWHSHGGGNPTPSRRDGRVLWRIADSTAARSKQPIMVIIGELPEGTVTGWTLNRSGMFPRFWGGAIEVDLIRYDSV